MRKVKLNLDDLAVESFATADVDPATRGTVQGHDATALCETRITRCYQDTCAFSCDGSCVGGQQVC